MAEGPQESVTTSEQLDKKLKYGPLAKALYIMVSFFEGYDQQVLSMCMRAFELTLGFSQSQLSTLATVSTMSRMGCCLIWGLLADQHNSNYVLGGGLLVMGIASIFLSSASHYKVLEIVFLRFLHGFGFACVYPVQQKIVSDSTMSKEEEDKMKAHQQNGDVGSSGASVEPGRESTEVNSPKESKKKESKEASTMFTALQALNCIGRLLCAVITTIIARKVLLGYYGWRTSYVVLGYVWILFAIGIIFGLLPEDPQKTKDPGGFTTLLSGTFSGPFTRASTWILIFTLFIAEAPMCAFNYMTIYLQYLGVSDTMAGVAIAVTLIGGAAGSGAGGEIIKTIANNYGHYYVELGSGVAVMIVRVVVCLLFFLGKSPCGKLLWYHYIELATLGGTLVTVGGVDRALLKSAVENTYQATASATVRTISGIASSVILFQISAYLTEKVFGYVPSRESFETMVTDIKERNAEALRKSMMYIILAGTAINTLCYIALFFRYETDKKEVDKVNGTQTQATQTNQKPAQ